MTRIILKAHVTAEKEGEISTVLATCIIDTDLQWVPLELGYSVKKEVPSTITEIRVTVEDGSSFLQPFFPFVTTSSRARP